MKSCDEKKADYVMYIETTLKQKIVSPARGEKMFT